MASCKQRPSSLCAELQTLLHKKKKMRCSWLLQHPSSFSILDTWCPHWGTGGCRWHSVSSPGVRTGKSGKSTKCRKTLSSSHTHDGQVHVIPRTIRSNH